MTTLAGPVSGVCDICGITTGCLPKHRKACARKAGQVPATGPLTEAELAAIDRAGSFAVADAVLDYDRQLHNGVTDLDMARLLLALDQGAEIVMGGRTDRWLAPAGSPLKGMDGRYQRRSLSKVVNEAIRLGLVFVATDHPDGIPALVRTFIVPSLTHVRSRFNRLAPMCARPTNSIKRYRLLDPSHLVLVDCQRCVDVARFG